MAPSKPSSAAAAINKGGALAKIVDVAPSLSASVVILAPLSERTLDGYDYRVLLLKRHAKSSTFVSAHVFPGGNLDPSDTSPEWASFFPSPSTLLPSSVSAEAERRMQAIKICAVRETFEECGILLHDSMPGQIPGRAAEVWAGVGEEERRQWRDKVHSNGHSFIELFKLLSSKSGGTLERPGISKLTYRANWITPRKVKRRYDTHFFVAVLPPTSLASEPTAPSDSTSPIYSTPIVSSDGKETISADWLTPGEAIRRTLPHPSSSSGAAPSSIILFPPQFYLLSELAPHKSLASLLDPKNPSRVEGRLVQPFEPELIQVPDLQGQLREATVLPGDPAHSQTPSVLTEHGTTASKDFRHRSYVLTPETDKNGLRMPGLTVTGCHREGMSEIFGKNWENMRQGNVGADPSKSKL